MKKDLPQLYKNNFFKKIFLKIKNIFNKNKRINNIKENKNQDLKENNTPQHTSIANMKKEIKASTDTIQNYNIKNERKKFLKLLKEKPELLEKFSVEKLEIILAEYKKENEIKRRKLKKK